MVWRELRRIPFEVVKDAPEYIQQAWHAAQKTIAADGEATQRADYASYLKAIGGAAMPRKSALIQLAKVHYDTPGRYGEALGEKPIGIFASDAPLKVYESTRYQWQRVDLPAEVSQTIATDGEAQARAALKKTGFGGAWTRVNNCTHGSDALTLPEPFSIEKTKPKNFNFDRMRC